MTKFGHVLLTCFALKSSYSMAQETLPRDDAAMELNFAYSQQAYGTLGLDILAPRMGNWGRLGIGFGSATYFASPAEGKDRLLSVNHKALVWRLDEPFLKVAMGSSAAAHTLGLASTLRLGIQSYENWIEEKVQENEHTFFEVEALFQLKSMLEPGSQAWIRRTTFGLGTGIRTNSINKVTYIGSKQVDRLHVYPTLQFSMLLF